MFHTRGLVDVGDNLKNVYDGLGVHLGSHANVLFGIGLLASGLSSSAVGTMAGQTMTVRGAAIRRTSADIVGFAYYHAPTDVQAQAYGELCRLAAAGELALDIETRPLAQIAAAWDARAAGNRRRQVLIP